MLKIKKKLCTRGYKTFLCSTEMSMKLFWKKGSFRNREDLQLKKTADSILLRFTLAIIINNVRVSKYAYAAVTIFNGTLKAYIFHLHLRDAAKLT